jgi:hypothetical protein
LIIKRIPLLKLKGKESSIDFGEWLAKIFAENKAMYGKRKKKYIRRKLNY